MTDSAVLRHGQVSPVTGGRVAVAFLSNPEVDGEPVHARLSIKPRGGPEEALVVHVGDRFRVGDVEWILDRIDNVGTYDFEVHIRTLGD